MVTALAVTGVAGHVESLDPASVTVNEATSNPFGCACVQRFALDGSGFAHPFHFFGFDESPSSNRIEPFVTMIGGRSSSSEMKKYRRISTVTIISATKRAVRAIRIHALRDTVHPS